LSKSRIFFILVILIAVTLICSNLSLSKDDYIEQYREAANRYYELLATAKASGYDTSEAEELMEQAKVAEKEGFYRAALIIIEQAIETLETKLEGQPDFIITPSSEPTKTPEPTITQKPTEIPLPTITPTPVRTPEPTGTPQPLITQKPTEIPLPTITPTPVRTPETIETPEVTETPKATEKPTVTETPEGTETPEIITPEDAESCPFGLDGCHQTLFEELLPHYKNTGVKWLLFNSIIWEDNKPPDWSVIDGFIKKLTGEGFSLIIEIHLSSNGFPDDPSDYGKFISRCVSRYDGDGDYNNDGLEDGEALPAIYYWKIWNEPALKHFWDDSPEDYAELIRISGINAHEANPEAKIIFGGFSNKGEVLGEKTEDEFMTRFYSHTFSDGTKACDYLDFMNYNYYGTSEGLTDFLKYQLELMKKYNINKPFMMTEYGYTGGVNFSFEDGSSRESSIREQALEVIKSHITALSLGAEKIIYFSFSDQKRQLKDISSDAVFVSSKSAEDIYTHDILSYNGLAYFDYEPKPAAKCYEVMVEKLNNKKISHELLGMAKGARCFVFVNKNSTSKEEKPLYILWNEGEEEQNISVDLGWQKAKITSFLLIKGEEVYTGEINAKEGLFEIHLGKEPVFLEYLPE